MDATWISAVGGGMLIGIGTLTLYALSGRIAGISGIAYGLLTGAVDRHWRVVFLAGLILGAWIANGLTSATVSTPEFSARAALNLLGAGLLVGIGTRLGNGCTSGHGICGLSRFSARSLAATMTFMLAGIITATTLSQILGR